MKVQDYLQVQVTVQVQDTVYLCNYVVTMEGSVPVIMQITVQVFL